MFTAPLPTATRTSIIVERAQALKTLGETYHEDSEDFIQAKKEIMQDTAKRIAAIDKQEKAAKGPSPAQVKQEKYGFKDGGAYTALRVFDGQAAAKAALRDTATVWETPLSGGVGSNSHLSYHGAIIDGWPAAFMIKTEDRAGKGEATIFSTRTRAARSRRRPSPPAARRRRPAPLEPRSPTCTYETEPTSPRLVADDKAAVGNKEASPNFDEMVPLLSYAGETLESVKKMDEGKAAKLVKTLAGHKDIKAVALNPIADALHVPTTCKNKADKLTFLIDAIRTGA